MISDADLWSLAERLYPLKRTVQGPAVLETLGWLDHFMQIATTRTHVPVGSKVFDWTVLPDAENRRAYHPSFEEVPAFDGPLTYAEAVIPGDEMNEVLLSTYTCHPQMANDNVSGMVVTAALGRWLASAPRRYTYRLLFAPETIGALCWLAARPAMLKVFGGGPIIAGYTINNCGDERAWSFVPSRKGDTLADRAARHTLDALYRWQVSAVDAADSTVTVESGWNDYSFADRGSDERQFCAPGVDLPIASVMRSKHGTYPEYHTPNDQLGTVVTAKGLGDSFRCYQQIIETIEANRTYRCQTIGEPRLDRYGLYPTTGGPDATARMARDLCAYSDGSTDLIAIADATNHPISELARIAEQLFTAGVLQ